MIAERLDHHPEWANVYNKVDVRVITHDVDAISPLDSSSPVQRTLSLESNRSAAAEPSRLLVAAPLSRVTS